MYDLIKCTFLLFEDGINPTLTNPKHPAEGRKCIQFLALKNNDDIFYIFHILLMNVVSYVLLLNESLSLSAESAVIGSE